MKTLGRRQAIGGAAVALGAGAYARSSQAQTTTVELLSHRYPALEHYTEKFRTALPGVQVKAQLMPIDKQIELASIALSSKSSNLDLVYVSNSTVVQFAARGWLRPLNDLWAKYKDEFNLGDLNPDIVKQYEFNGQTFAVPGNTTINLFAYRQDVLDAAGSPPPKTIPEYVNLAKKLHSPRRAGTTLNLKPGDGVYTEVHWHLNATADGWFDDKWRPVFNSERGVRAVETVKELAKYAPPGFTSAGTDEVTILLQQDGAAMGLSYSSRAQSYDDPTKSLVRGKMNFMAPPGGGGRVNSDGYAISAFSKKDPEVLFRLIATALNEKSQREGKLVLVPTRLSVLTDPAVVKEIRHYPASIEALKTSVALPQLPEIYAVGEFISRRVGQAVTGEMPVKQALDLAAKETEEFLRRAGYYKN